MAPTKAAKPMKPQAGLSSLPLEDVRRIEGEYYILATSALADDLDRVLKQGDTFAIFDHYGDIKPVGLREEGVYHHDTRYCSSLILKLGRTRPLVLSSLVERDNARLVVDLTNPDMTIGDGPMIPHGTVHIRRTKFLWAGACYEQIQVRNYGPRRLALQLALHVDADFADVFEVRGARRAQRGRRLAAEVGEGTITHAYQGLDGVLRRARFTGSPVPDRISEHDLRFELSLAPREQCAVQLVISCESERAAPGAPASPASSSGAGAASGDGAARPSRPALGAALRASRRAIQRAEVGWAGIYTSNETFNEWINRSNADLRMMVTQTPHGPYPHAGVPWFSTPFGRDGIITAMECLWVSPPMARGVLAFLAATQADADDVGADAEPGKIIHEMRRGEMAAAGEIPFGQYYGSVDATPLFVMLAGAYYQRTGELEFIREIWPNIERALQWIEERSDTDGDGFTEAVKRRQDGLDQQGWKDSHDSVFHADGAGAEGPIALCEVQAYIFAAQRSAADLAEALGLGDRAGALRASAEGMRIRFEEAFWRPEMATYAMALDGRKRPCDVRSSNAGHCLFAGIADPQRARLCAQTLLNESGYSGWGVRTLASSEVRYNPMSYHNGSIWPHDNAIIAAGLARYGLKDGALRVLTGIFDTSLFVHLHRLPELFCGFGRRPGASPTLYPVACSPQAWAAGAVHMLLQACLGLEVDAPRRTLRFQEPRLPPFLERVDISDLRVGEASISVRLTRTRGDVSVDVRERRGDVQLTIVK